MSELDKRITSLEESVSILLQHIKDVNLAIVTGFEKVDKNFEAIKEDIKSIRNNVSDISGNVKDIRGKSKATLETVEISLDNLTTEIKKINEVSGYEDIYANNKGLKIVQAK